MAAVVHSFGNSVVITEATIRCYSQHKAVHDNIQHIAVHTHGHWNDFSVGALILITWKSY